MAGVVQGKGEDVSPVIDYDSVASPRTGGDSWLLAGHGGHGIQGMQSCQMARKVLQREVRGHFPEEDTVRIVSPVTLAEKKY